MTPSYHRKRALFLVAGSLWMVLLGLLSAFYLHQSALLTVAFFAFAVFGLLGVPLRLWLARSMERSAERDRFANPS
jgi:lipopolysaccharide/colanic/teichoic acid biosynthesis glycosyltransferase